MLKLLLSAFICSISLIGVQAADQKPLMKDFLGINGHYTFKPEVYIKTCRLARNYHNINWDVKNVGDPITIPVCANKVHWLNNVYNKWIKAGYEIDMCLQFGSFGHKMENHKQVWLDNLDWCYEYGKRTSEFYGPSGANKIATSVEIGNEPGRRFNDEAYQALYLKMAQGLRDGDPKLKIVTATAHSHPADDYSKNMDETYGSAEMKKLYDVINVHTYAQIKRKNNSESPWNRSYPEDDSLVYMKVVDDTIDWRNKHAKGKEIWVTEFGYDSVTPDAMNKRTGWFKKLDWQGVSDLMQAQYIVRSIFLFAERDVDRAYIYFYDDKNAPGVHAGAGLTRNDKPKPSYWAVKQFLDVLGDYRLDKIVRQDKTAYIYAFSHESDKNKQVWVAWSPTGTQSHKKDGYVGKTAEIEIDKLPGQPSGIQGMATKKTNIPAISFEKTGSKAIKLTVSENPAYIIFGE